MTDDLEQELFLIDEELESIEQQMSQLLDRQQKLTARGAEIRAVLDIEDQKRTATSGAGDATPDLSQFDNEDFGWSRRLADIRKSVFCIDAFRPLQLSVMNATMSGYDTMLIMPTGGGKSLCYQLPALICEGITLVVTPLVSLMQDQVMALQDLNVAAKMLCADTDKDEAKLIQEAMTDKRAPLKLLYVTPEKIAKGKRFMAKVEKMYSMGRLARIAVDEVHCCSQWGHDFRPDYKILGILKRQFPNTPILGLTATATQRVLDDVKKILQLPKCLHFKASFNRANLFYEILPKPSSQKEMIEELQRQIERRFKDQSGIIYCYSRNETESVTSELRSRGIKAAFYHAYVDSQYRHKVHRDWITGKIQVIVATVAFGMGIDKPNVRFVIHHSLSKSMENYYQESGRAGRDDQPASCILFYRLADLFRQSTMVFTEQTGLENLYRMLEYCLDSTRCRRSLIARHFGERWDRSDCDKKCDHCSNNDRLNMEEKDVTRECAEAIRVIRSKSNKEKRLTGLEVAKLCRQEKGLLCKLGVPGTERIIGQMIIDGYLRENFHFTPYNTISYVVQGPRASLLDNPDKARSIKMKFTKIRTLVTSQSGAKNEPQKGTKAKVDIKSNACMTAEFSGASDSSRKNGPKVTKSKPIFIDLEDEEDDIEDNHVITLDQEPSSGSLESRSTKRKDTKTTLESEAKKIRLENEYGRDCVDGKRRTDRRQRAVSHPASSSDEEPETESITRPRRRRRRRLAKTLPTNLQPSDSNDATMATSPPPVEKELQTMTSLGSSLGDVSTIVRGVFMRLRRERETLSASLETENSMKEQSLRVLQFVREEPESRHIQSAPTTQNFERFSGNLVRSQSVSDVVDILLDEDIWQTGTSASVDFEGGKLDTKSTTDLEAESLDVNSNEVARSNSKREAQSRRGFCWTDEKEDNRIDIALDNDVVQYEDGVDQSSDTTEEEEDHEVHLDKSDELNSLYQIYTDQLSTLAVNDDSADEADSELARKPSNLAPIAEDNENEASSIVTDNWRISPKRLRTVSGSSAGSVDQSIINLDRMPEEPEMETLVTGVSADESEAEMTQLHDAYLNQLGHLK